MQNQSDIQLKLSQQEQKQPINLQETVQQQKQTPSNKNLENRQKYPSITDVKNQSINIKVTQKMVEPWVVQDVLQNSNILPTKDWNEQFAQDLHRSLLKAEEQDTKRVGQVLGLTVIGLIGFALTLSVIGLVAGSILGVVLGGYAGKRIKRKKQRGKNLIHFDLFMVNCACYYAVLLDEFQRNKENIKLNNFRFKIQRCFKEYRGVEIYNKLSQSRQKGFKSEMMRLVKLLSAQEAIKAMYLSYKITKIKLKQTKFQKPTEQQKHDIQYMLCIVLRPAILILRICNAQLTQEQKIILLKFEKLSLSYEALQLLSQDLPQDLEMNQQEFLENLEKEVTVTDIKEHFKEFDIEAILQENQDIKNQSPQKNQKNKNLIDVIQESIDYVEQRSAAKTPLNKNKKIIDGIKEEDSSSCSSLASDEVPNNDPKENQLLEQKNKKLQSKDISIQKNFQQMQSAGEYHIENQNNENSINLNINNDNNIKNSQNKQLESLEQKDRSKSIASQVKSREYNVQLNSPSKSKQIQNKSQHTIVYQQKQDYNKNNTMVDLNNINLQQKTVQKEQVQKPLQYNNNINEQQEQNQQQQKQQLQQQQVLNQQPKKQNNTQIDQSLTLGQSQKLTFHQMNRIAGYRDDFLELDDCASSYHPNQDENQNNTQREFQQEAKSFQRNQRGDEFLKCNTVKVEYVPKKFEQAFPQNQNNNTENEEDNDENENQDDDYDQQQNIVVGDVQQQISENQQQQQKQQGKQNEENLKRKDSNISKQSQKSNINSSQQKNTENLQQSQQIQLQIKDDNNEPQNFDIQAENKHTVIEDQEIQSKLSELIKMSEESIEEGKWNKVIDKPEMKIFKKQNLESAAVMVRATSNITNATPKDVWEQIYVAEERSKWDKVVLGFQQVEKIDEFSDVIYSYVDAGFGVTKRDWIQKRFYKFDYPQKGQISICYFSTEHPQHPPKKNHIRADSYIAGYVMTEKGKDTELFMLSCNDIKGLIPKYIVNYAAARAPKDWINSLQKALDTKLNNPKSKKK